VKGKRKGGIHDTLHKGCSNLEQLLYQKEWIKQRHPEAGQCST